MTGFGKLADLIIGVSKEALPQEAFEKIKDCLLDFFACSIVGSKDKIGSSIVDFTRSAGGLRESTVICGNLMTSCQMAALANGTMAHALDFDDLSSSIPGHPSAPVLPVALALGEKLSLSGKKILQAAIIGFEVECKVGRLTHPQLSKKGWHPTAILGTLGATACSGLLSGLEDAEMSQALGISSSLAGGLKANFGSMTKPLHTGMAAHNGIMAAELARRGWTAGSQPMEGRFGFLNNFAENCSLDTGFKEFAHPLEVISPGIRFKRYPSCGGTHPAIDALASLIRENNLNPRDIKRITCYVTPHIHAVAMKDKPTTRLEGKFSIPFCLATYLLHGKLELKHFQDETINSKEIKEMMGRIEIVEKPEFSEDGYSGQKTLVEIERESGEMLTEKIGTQKRPPGETFTEDELIGKYKNCLAGIIPEERANKILGGILDFENLTDIKEFMGLVRIP